MYEAAVKLNESNLLNFVERNDRARLLDLGCDDGQWTKRLAVVINTKKAYGIEIADTNIVKAQKKGIMVTKGDLNNKIPFRSSSFDVVHANQVIEHLTNIDKFLDEIYRVLKPSGYLIISTENASSWHNIFASIMGWQIFSLTNVSTVTSGIGNPFALHRHKKVDSKMVSWTHKTIFNYLGLKEILEEHHFNIFKIMGAGYYPFPAKFGRFDKRHAHFLTIKAYKG